MGRLLVLAVSAALLCGGCFGSDHDLTDSGEGLPRVEVDFPASGPPGSVQTAVITVSNPGPGDMSGVAVTFARVGNFYPIVDGGARSENDAVVSVDPPPRSIDASGVVYRFGALPEGGSATFTFELRLPDRRGPAANSLTVSAAEDLERFRGLRLETDVR